MSGFVSIKGKTTSIARINRYDEIGFPCLLPPSNLKYGVVLPALITLDSEFFIKVNII